MFAYCVIQNNVVRIVRISGVCVRGWCVCEGCREEIGSVKRVGGRVRSMSE